MIRKIGRPEKIAKTLIKVKKLKPPIDIFKLIKEYAVLEIENNIPFEFDGLCFFKQGKPSIILNGDISVSRQKFTLAHELGHILIPGHKNIIACNAEKTNNMDFSDDDSLHWEYLAKEREANTFASEVLMPSDWIKELVENLKSFQDIIKKVTELTDLSIQAITIKVIKHMKPGNIIFINHLSNDIYTMYTSPSTSLYEYNIDYNKLKISELERKKLENVSKNIEKFVYKNYSVVVYDIYEDLMLEEDNAISEKSSTKILMEYLEYEYSKEEAKKYFNSINGVVGNMNGEKEVKSMSKAEYYKAVNRKFRNKNEIIRSITNTKYFSEYIAKRYEELKNK